MARPRDARTNHCARASWCGCADSCPESSEDGRNCGHPYSSEHRFVHGAWADGSSWSGVIEQLQADGYPRHRAAVPDGRPRRRSRPARQVLQAQDGPTIVAGHSYGGQIMTALGTDAPNMAGLVYIAAFGIDQGKSLSTAVPGTRHPGTSAPDRRCAGLRLAVRRRLQWYHFAADVDPVKAKVMYAVQQALAASAFGTEMGAPAWKSLPTWYLVAANDEAIPPTPSASSPAAWARSPSKSLQPRRHGLPPRRDYPAHRARGRRCTH